MPNSDCECLQCLLGFCIYKSYLLEVFVSCIEKLCFQRNHKRLPELTGIVQKNPFKIHKHFTNLCNTAWKSNTKVHNSSTHPVKGATLTGANGRCTPSVKTDSKCVLCDFAWQLLFFNYCSVLGNAVSD